MKASELRDKDMGALQKEVSDLLKAHFGLRMQRATQQLTNHAQLSRVRKDIARAKTVMAEKRRDAAPPSDGAATANAVSSKASVRRAVAKQAASASAKTATEAAAARRSAARKAAARTTIDKPAAKKAVVKKAPGRKPAAKKKGSKT